MSNNPPQTIIIKEQKAPGFMDTCCACGCLSFLILVALAGCATLFG